jgi:hypothetical protein
VVSVNGKEPEFAKSSAANELVSRPERSLSDITLVRSRMFFAKASINARGMVHPGLKHMRKSRFCKFQLTNLYQTQMF